MKRTLEVTKEEYLQWRNDQNKDEILRAYFNYMTGQSLDYGNFMVIYMQALDEHPGLEEDIEKGYPDIVHFLDKSLHLTFLIENKEIVTKETQQILLQIL